MPQLSMPPHIGWSKVTRCNSWDKHKLPGTLLTDLQCHVKLCYAHARLCYAHAVRPLKARGALCSSCWICCHSKRAKQEWQQQAEPLTIGEGGVGVSELIKEGVGKRPDGCHSGHWAVMQQLGHLQVATQNEKGLATPLEKTSRLRITQHCLLCHASDRPAVLDLK